MQWWPPISVRPFCVKNEFHQPCSGTGQLQSDNLQWAIGRESELLHQTLGSCFSAFSLAGSPGSQNIVTITMLWRVNSVRQRDYLSDLYWDVGGDLSDRHVPSHLANYKSKSIAQTPLGYQQTDSGTPKDTNGCSLFTKDMPAQKTDSSSVPGMPGLMLAKLPSLSLKTVFLCWGCQNYVQLAKHANKVTVWTSMCSYSILNSSTIYFTRLSLPSLLR